MLDSNTLEIRCFIPCFQYAKVEKYFALCKLSSKCIKNGKVRNFEGHFALSIDTLPTTTKIHDKLKSICVMFPQEKVIATNGLEWADIMIHD